MSVNDPKRTLESGQFYTDFYRARAHAVADRTVSSKRPGIQSNFLTGTQPGVRYPRSEAYRAKGDVMQLPKIFQGESLTRLIQGAVAGFLATVVIGFGWGGWTLGSTAMKMANQSANSAVVTALAPICVDKFQHAAEAKATLVELKAIDSWKQDTFVEKGGWATFPGTDSPNRNVAEACAKMLTNVK